MNLGDLEGLDALLKEYAPSISITWNDELVRSESQWGIFREWVFEEKVFRKAWFGDFKTGKKSEWSSDEKYTKAEAEMAEKYIQEALELERKTKEEEQLRVAVQCQREFENFRPDGTTPYMLRKKIGELFGARIRENENGDPILVVPLRDTDGILWNYQRIYSQRLSHGDKFFAEGARIEGLFHILGDEAISPDVVIYIAEGFATAASIKTAMPTMAVVAAFNAGNLASAALALKEKYPTCSIIICADNDAYTAINGKPYNVGVEKARRAAGQVKGKIVYPIFKYPAKGFTDFNDLHQAEGLDKVRDQILHPEKYVTGIQPMCLATKKNGQEIEPSEKEVTEYLLRFFDGRIVKQDRILFKYVGTHWVELKLDEIDKIKQMIAVAANGILGSRELTNYFNYFSVHVPTVPHGTNLFMANPFAANFKNGTLLATKGPDGVYKTTFHKHDARDFLTNVLPFELPPWQPGEELPPAPMFDQLVEDMWSDNPDKAQVHLLAHELLGAALMPAFPMIVIFHGKPNSGKSTFVLLVKELVHKENTSNIPPSDMHTFYLETMVGKLVNYDTDIDTNKPMNDTEMKKIIDRSPRSVRRKGVKNIEHAYLPALHLFAGNRPPKSLDGSSHAYGRRMILVRTESLKLKGDRIFNYHSVILEKEIAGVLARALQGLYRLLDNDGLYTIPETSFDQVREMENESDVVGQFLEDVNHGEVETNGAHKLSLEPDARIERPALWECFNNWQKLSNTNVKQIGKIDFFNNLARRGFELKRDAKNRYFLGLGLKVEKDPIA